MKPPLFALGGLGLLLLLALVVYRVVPAARRDHRACMPRIMNSEENLRQSRPRRL